jgi:hypothetical protein
MLIFACYVLRNLYEKENDAFHFKVNMSSRNWFPQSAIIIEPIAADIKSRCWESVCRAFICE